MRGASSCRLSAAGVRGSFCFKSYTCGSSLLANLQRVLPLRIAEARSDDDVGAVGVGAKGDPRVQIPAAVVVGGEALLVRVEDMEERIEIGALHVDDVALAPLQVDLVELLEVARRHRAALVVVVELVLDV